MQVCEVEEAPATAVASTRRKMAHSYQQEPCPNVCAHWTPRLKDSTDALAYSGRAFEVLFSVDLQSYGLASCDTGWSAVVRGGRTEAAHTSSDFTGFCYDFFRSSTHLHTGDPSCIRREKWGCWSRSGRPRSTAEQGKTLARPTDIGHVEDAASPVRCRASRGSRWRKRGLDVRWGMKWSDKVVVQLSRRVPQSELDNLAVKLYISGRLGTYTWPSRTRSRNCVVEEARATACRHQVSTRKSLPRCSLIGRQTAYVCRAGLETEYGRNAMLKHHFSIQALEGASFRRL